jgi:hypothetical protein
MSRIDTFEKVAAEAPHRAIVSTINPSALATPVVQSHLTDTKCQELSWPKVEEHKVITEHPSTRGAPREQGERRAARDAQRQFVK